VIRGFSNLHRFLRCNFTIPFIDFFAWLGWAYDLKTVSDETIRKRVLRTGDGSHRYSEKLDINQNHAPARDVDHFWGYGEGLPSKFDEVLTSFS
jgi:hypothetical protein